MKPLPASFPPTVPRTMLTSSGSTREKARRGADVDQHFHLVLAHVGPDGKALRDSNSYRKLEAVARTLEVDFGHALTASRRTAAVAAELERIAAPGRRAACPEYGAAGTSPRRHGQQGPRPR